MIENRPIKLGLGLPHYGGTMVTRSVDMWMSLGAALMESAQRFELAFRLRLDVCGIEHARNQIVAAALEANVDWLLMIDTDTWYDDAFDILQAISDADRTGHAVLAVATPQRALNEEPHLMIYTRGGPERKGDATLEPISHRTLEHRLKVFGEKLWPVDAAATSMMAIDLNFVKKHLAPPWFRFDWRYGTLEYTSEDKSFCNRITEAGGTIVTPTNFVASHRVRPKEI